jgi:SAM-dependent methyltransferase
VDGATVQVCKLTKPDRIEINSSFFDGVSREQFTAISPHLAHPTLRALWSRLAVSAYQTAARDAEVPSVLDLGAGDGSSSLVFLEQGAAVTAVDASAEQLRRLCQSGLAPERLAIRQQSVEDYLRENRRTHDIIVASSFLHHVPDYLALVTSMAGLAAPHGQILLFQDPLRYDTQGRFTRSFDILSYAFWRMFQPDFLGGVKRRLRRMRGIYLEDCPQDNVEYHVTRNGVDQDAIAALLREFGFKVEIIRYWSQQSALFQSLGTWAQLENCFGIVARREA